jgi:hypothetical protein
MLDSGPLEASKIGAAQNFSVKNRIGFEIFEDKI